MRKVAFKKYHDFSGNTDGNFFFFHGMSLGRIRSESINIYRRSRGADGCKSCIVLGVEIYLARRETMYFRV